MAELVDREGNIWFGDTKGIHRFFYTPLIRQEFPKETSESSDFAVVADDNGAVWISFGSGGANINSGPLSCPGRQSRASSPAGDNVIRLPRT